LREVVLPEASGFSGVSTGSFEYIRRMSAHDFVDMLATYSAIITASEDERSAELARIRAELDRQFPGASHLDVPIRTQCWRADRTTCF
jgi:hypothetical protein